MKIKGNTVGTPMPRTNYNQTDPTKADYLVGRENIMSAEELKKYVDDKLKDVGGSGGGGGTGEGGVGEIPKTLPNPHAITFKGAVNATYDGSEAVEVVIPTGEGGGLPTLIVTGSLNEAILTSTGNKSINLQGELPSGSPSEILNDFLGGREVRIELVDTEYEPGNYSGTSLPKMKRIEARVVELVEDGDNSSVFAIAEGFGSTDSQEAFYRVEITVDPRLDAFTVSALYGYEPLVVTGSPKCNAIMMGGTNYAMYQIKTLSHTAKDICDAFGRGRDVYIRLENAMAIGSLVSGSPLPDIKNIEARVVSAQKDMMYPNGYAVAYGTGYTVQAGQFYMVNISLSNDTISVTAYLFKAYDSNVATKTDVNNALKNVAYTNDINELKAYVDEQLKDVGGGEGSGGVSDWNDLTNRPFYDDADGTVAKQLDDKYLQMLEVSETDVFSEQDVAFSYFDDYGCYLSAFPADTFTLVEGEEYKVLWGTTEYTCSAVYYESMAATALGNPVIIGGEDNGLPFGVGSDATGGVTFFAFEETTTKVRIYQSKGYKVKPSYFSDSLYTEIDNRIEAYINEALGGDGY